MKSESIDTDRIIGNCLEINSEILSERFNSNLPNLLSSIKESYYRKKLIKAVNKIGNGNIPMNRNNLLELFSYIFSNFPPYGEYKNIKRCLYYPNIGSGIWKVTVAYSDYRYYTITIDTNEKNVFDVDITVKDKDTGEITSLNTSLKELYTKKDYIRNYIQDLNQIIINLIMNYTLDSINSTTSKSVIKKKG